MNTEKRKVGRPKGIPKTGGRKPGTPNKISSQVREILSETTFDYYASEQFQKDLSMLEPKYVAPQLQSTTLDVAAETKKTIEDRLIALSGDK